MKKKASNGNGNGDGFPLKGVNANTIVIPLAIIIPIIGATWILSAQLSGISGKGDRAIAATEDLRRKVETMDANGTQGTQLQLKNNLDRIVKLEDTTSKLVPDVTQIRTDLSWISDWVKAQKHQGK